ncbi:NADH dehydrogenase (ubiquinone) complex assembly factor 6 [Brachionus plicatilis]|uniref:NADH dehydrogenase (Ubiquinone) complex assembly factor 6 n=1 Tax=Brachionus plicatilis TaxID=10195 RepID=A0A3M7SB79_BRAPC|nr:NADH dehydrogenase (ubiquinone) complex assembly factor 6 [Brachionus plicatilis]
MLSRRFVKLTLNNVRYSSRQTNFQYCIDLVKNNDYDSYLTTLLTPQQVLRPAFTLKAFSMEITNVGKSAIDSRVGEAKLVYWKDQIDKVFASVKKNEQTSFNDPISQEIYLMAKFFNLSKARFSRFIDAKKNFLSIQQFKSFDELESFADYANLNYILFNCLGINNVDCDHAANHIGKAQFLCFVTKNILKMPTQMVYYLPRDLLLKHKISQQDLFNFSERILRPKRQNFKDLAFDMCSRANDHIRSARSLSNKIPGNAKPILATSVNCDIFLSKMQKYDFDLMDPKLNSNFRTLFLIKLILAKLKNNY